MQCRMFVDDRFVGHQVLETSRTVNSDSIKTWGMVPILTPWPNIKKATGNNIETCYVDSSCAGDLILHDRPQEKSAKFRQPPVPGLYQRLNFETIKVYPVNLVLENFLLKSMHCLNSHSSECHAEWVGKLATKCFPARSINSDLFSKLVFLHQKK